MIFIDEDAEALINLGYAISAGEVTRADLEAMEWFQHPKTKTQRRYKKEFLHVLGELEAGNDVLYPDPIPPIPIPSEEETEALRKGSSASDKERNTVKPTQAEIDEMDDFGQYVSWILKHNGKAPG